MQSYADTSDAIMQVIYVVSPTRSLYLHWTALKIAYGFAVNPIEYLPYDTSR